MGTCIREFTTDLALENTVQLNMYEAFVTTLLIFLQNCKMCFFLDSLTFLFCPRSPLLLQAFTSY